MSQRERDRKERKDFRRLQTESRERLDQSENRRRFCKQLDEAREGVKVDYNKQMRECSDHERLLNSALEAGVSPRTSEPLRRKVEECMVSAADTHLTLTRLDKKFEEKCRYPEYR